MEVIKYLRVKEQLAKDPTIKRKIELIMKITPIYMQSNVVMMQSSFISEYSWIVVAYQNEIEQASEQFKKLIDSWENGTPMHEAIGDSNKAHAIMQVMQSVQTIVNEYLESKDKIEYLGQLPYIGEESKYLLARNLGEQVFRPELITEATGSKDPERACQLISNATGDKLSVIDYIIYKAYKEGMI